MKPKAKVPFSSSMMTFGVVVFMFGMFFQEDGVIVFLDYDWDEPLLTMWVGLIIFSSAAFFGAVAVVAARVNAKNRGTSPETVNPPV
jgi:hypothetical protein